MRWWAGANDAPSSNSVKIYHEEHEAHGGMVFFADSFNVPTL
jgi:hypothetical protein